MSTETSGRLELPLVAPALWTLSLCGLCDLADGFGTHGSPGLIALSPRLSEFCALRGRGRQLLKALPGAMRRRGRTPRLVSIRALFLPRLPLFLTLAHPGLGVGLAGL